MKKLFLGVLVSFFASASNAGILNKTSTGIPISANGKTTTFGSGNSVAYPATGGAAPPSSSQIGQSGWYYGTGAATHPPSGSTMNMGANGDVYLSGTKYPFQAGYKVPTGAIALAALGLVGGWPGALIGVSLAAAPHIKDWFDDAGVTPDPAQPGNFLVKEDGGCYSDCYWYSDTWGYGWKKTSPEAICQAYADRRGFTGAWYLTNGGSQCVLGSTGTLVVQRDESRRPDDQLPKSMDDIAPYLMRTPFKPGIVDDIIKNGGEIPLPNPTITGPTSIAGQPVTSTTTGTQTINGQQVPTRTETTTQTTYNFTTNNNQVTNTTNKTSTVTNTYNQSTGALISSDTAEKTETPEEEEQVVDSALGPVPKLYEQKYPDGLTGVWNGKKSELSQTSFFTMIDQLTPKVGQSGSCPSWSIDLSWTPGGSMGVHQLQPPCMIWPILKLIIIISALFLARALVFGG